MLITTETLYAFPPCLRQKLLSPKPKEAKEHLMSPTDLLNVMIKS